MSSTTTPASPAPSSPAQPDRIATPAGFLWGAATAAHQVEGSNIASDWWQLEHAGVGVITEPSGDAADHFHRWPEDLDLLADLGLNSYRFSLEWSRIEPERGYISRAAIEHYRRMAAGCLDRGLTPVVTLQHVTLPAWLTRAGGWAAPDAHELFGRFTETALPVLREGVEWVVTINEPNLQPLMSALHRGDPRALAVWNGGPMIEATDDELADLIRAHRTAGQVVREATGARVGWSVAVSPVHATPEGQQHADAAFETSQGRYLREAARDDFVGVQTYTRACYDEDGPAQPSSAARMTSLWEYYPEALGEAVRATAQVVGDTPILITENGIPTDDDADRVEYIDRALKGLEAAMVDGIDVRGYLHWSALDNFEWALGYAPRFGLIGVDPETFERQVKPSARWYGELARRSITAAGTTR